ncbi:MAG: hypothetical protein H6832_12045 [Planctomycetes bacterium]|nr:hypothetical protein [Planctomycetota bacterium]
MNHFHTPLQPTILALTLAFSTGALTAQPTLPPQSFESGNRILLLGTVGSPHSVPGIDGEFVLDPATMMSMTDDGTTLGELRRRLGRLPGTEALYYQLFTVGSNPKLSAPQPLVANLLTEAACRALAERFVARASPDLEGWQNARLGASVPFYRPDVDGIAYYEFAVAPVGFVIVSTGAHDIPVASFSHLSSPHSQRLRSQAGAVAGLKIHRLSDSSYVGESSAGVVARLGTLPVDADRDHRAAGPISESETWASYRTQYAALFAKGLDQRRSSAAIAWKHQRDQVCGPNDTWAKHLNFAGSIYDQRLYNQYQRFDCQSGCVPTAWAMLIGWTDVRAHGGDPRWSRHIDLFRSGGTTYGNPAFVAPQQLKDQPVPPEVRNLVELLRYHQGTTCSGNAGSTMPGLAAQLYLTLSTHPTFGGKGLVSCHGDWDTWHIIRNTYRDYAIGSIQAGMPCVVGRDSHAWLAWGYQAWGLFRGTEELYRFDEYFLTNKGWGGIMEWIPAAIYNVFSITEGQYIETAYERCRCDCSVQFLGSDNVWREVRRDGRPVRIPVSGGAVRWRCGGTLEWSRFRSDATFVEVTRPNAFPAGLIIVHAMK